MKPKATQLLELFRNIDPDMSVSCALALLYCNEEKTQRDVETRLGLSNAAASRNVSYWSEWKKHKVQGQNMINQTIDPEDRRYRLVSLNAKGKAFIAQINDITE